MSLPAGDAYDASSPRTRSARALPPATAGDSADDEVVECGHRIRLRPQPDLARPVPRVAMVDQELAVEVPLDVIADGDHAHRVPLAERRRVHSRRRELIPAVI